MALPLLFLDFETRSLISVRDVGAYQYARHPTTDVLCAALAKGDGPVVVWKRGGRAPWLDLIREGKVHLVAHNIEFEREILHHVLKVPTPLSMWTDTAALSARMGLPRSLEEAAPAAGLPEVKDVEGQRVMMKLSRPRKKGIPVFWEEHEKPEDFALLYAYCKQDVVVTRMLYKVLPGLSAYERRVWEMTIGMNERGVVIDVPALEPAIAEAEEADRVLCGKFDEVMGMSPRSPKLAAAMDMPDMTKATVTKWLRIPDLPAKHRRALELRQMVAKTSAKKIHAFQKYTADDGRLRGFLMYCGAERTGRWSAPGVQLQNMPKGSSSMDADFDLLCTGQFDLKGKNTLKYLSDMLRGFILGPFKVGDFAQIEARLTAWLAGDMEMLASFRHRDPYKDMAAVIYGVQAQQVTKQQREMGKRAILGCGYGMGAEKFQWTLSNQYDTEVTLEFAQKVVKAYRAKHKTISRYWYRIEDQFKRAFFAPSGTVTVDRINGLEMGRLEHGGIPFMYIKLQSGRCMYYAYPEVVDDKIRYYGRNIYKGGMWELVDTWGGKLCENVVQALSRDLLAHVMLALEDVGYQMVMTVHDEVVAQGEGNGRFEEIMRTCPPWLRDFPLGVDVYICNRYQRAP